MKFRNRKIPGRNWAVAAVMVLGLMGTTESAKAEMPIPAANFTSFTDQALSDYPTENLRADIKDEIIRKKLAVFALTAKFDGKQACFSMMGLTEAAPKNRHQT